MKAMFIKSILKSQRTIIKFKVLDYILKALDSIVIMTYKLVINLIKNFLTNFFMPSRSRLTYIVFCSLFKLS